jgi:hypothetical protein
MEAVFAWCKKGAKFIDVQKKPSADNHELQTKLKRESELLQRVCNFLSL